MNQENSILNYFRCLVLVLFAVFILGMPINGDGGTLYRCVDHNREETFSDYPLENQVCRQIQSEETEKKLEGDEKKISHSAAKEKMTEIQIRADGVFVPVTLVYGNREIQVSLLMDTGASITTLFTQAGEALYINLKNAQKAQGTVVGGGKIDAHRIKINNLIVGPNVFCDWNIFIVPNQEIDAKYDGLLGMDVLSRMRYKIDFQKKVIIWE